MYIEQVGNNVYCKDNSNEVISHALIHDLTNSTSLDDEIKEISNKNKIIYLASIKNISNIKGCGTFIMDYIKEGNPFIFLECTPHEGMFFEKNGFVNYKDNTYVFNGYKDGKPIVKDAPDIYHIKEITENSLKYKEEFESNELEK